MSFVVPVQSVFIGVDAIRRGFARRRPEQQLLGNPGEGPVSQAGVGSEQKVPGMQQRISRGCRRGWGPRQGRLQLLTPVAIGSRAEAIGQALAFDGDSAGEAAAAAAIAAAAPGQSACSSRSSARAKEFQPMSGSQATLSRCRRIAS